jgi:DNA-binding NtrC family response regulator
MITQMQDVSAPHRILLVDDESQVRESLRQVFASENFQVTATGTLAEALGSLQSDPCDVAVIDFHVEGNAGHDLVRQIKGIHPHVPVVMTTTCPWRAPSSVLDDCVAMLVKPFDVPVLLATVRAASARSRVCATSAHQTAVQC